MTITDQSVPSAIRPNLTEMYIDLWLVAFCLSLMSTFGILTNVINQATFISLGFKAPLNSPLMCLATSDFLMSIFTFIFSMCRMDRIFPVNTMVDYLVVQRISGFFRNFFIDFSSALTTCISIERCLCVTFPFMFKSTMDSIKNKIIVISIVAFFLANYIPVFATVCVGEHLDPVNNKTRYELCDSNIHNRIIEANDVVFSITLSLTCQSSAVVCAVFMQRGLRKSSEVRVQWKNDEPGIPSGVTQRKMLNGSLSLKERRLVKMIMIIALLYIPTGMPTFLLGCVRVFYPEIFAWISEGAFNMYTINTIVVLLGSIHGCLNIFVYYKFNSAYRKMFQKMFCV